MKHKAILLLTLITITLSQTNNPTQEQDLETSSQLQQNENLINTEIGNKTEFQHKNQDAKQEPKTSQTESQTQSLNMSTKLSTKHSNIEHPKSHHTHKTSAYIVLFITSALIIGALCRHIKKLTSIPYTPLLLLSGVFLGCYSNHLGDLGLSTQIALQINPHGILFIFIPTLIFESAFNIDPYILKKELVQICILAVFGVIIGIGLTGIAFRIMLGYQEFCWSAVFLFSSIVCATDPVAVVALLKDLGTSQKFNMLLEGESLLNDGTSMVFFMMFTSIFKGEGKGLVDVIVDFVWLSIGGVLIGCVACFVIILWLKVIVRDDILTNSITFIACYFTFFVSEFYFGVSGIIAIVTLGTMMGKFGKVNMNPESEHSVHAVWSFIQYAFETVLFILTGSFIGFELLSDGLVTITKYDVLKTFIFFLLIIAIRFIMFFMLKNSVNQFGWPIDNKDIVILSYGGLRGAIALSLGLIVAFDDSFSNRFREIVIFYITSMIFLTVLFNGLTIKWVMKKINFQPVNPIKKKVALDIKKQLIVETFKKKHQFLQNKYLNLVNWNEIIELTGVKEFMQSIREDDEEQIKSSGKFDNDKQLREKNEPLIIENNKEAVEETRLRFYQLLKSEIWMRFEESLCGSTTVRLLNELVDLCAEEIEKPIWIWECINQNFLTIEKIESLMEWKDVFFVGFFCKKYLQQQIQHNYELMNTLIVSLTNINKTKKFLPIQLNYIKLVFAELSMNFKKCQDFLFHFIELFPDLAKAIQQKQAAKMLLNTQKHLLDEFLHKGSINEREHEKLRTKIETRIKKIEIVQTEWNIQKLDQLKILCPIFNRLKENHFQLILDKREK